MAEIPDIDEAELFAFIHAFPTIWDRDNPYPGVRMNSLIEKIAENDTLVFGVFAYAIGTSQATLLLEYYRNERKAVFEIHVFGYDHRAEIVTKDFSEQRLKDIILGMRRKDFLAFLAFPPGAVVHCPHCKARYEFSAKMVSEDGSIVCQNCGREIPLPKVTWN